MYLFLLDGICFFALFPAFTFHNVSISTQASPVPYFCRNTLYIPQCIYFYKILLFILIRKIFLYIPQCIYFYSSLKSQFSILFTFTFHNVSISTRIILLFVPLLLALHSTMYLFLQLLNCTKKLVFLLYIPQCIYFYGIDAAKWNGTIDLYIPQCIYFYVPPDNLDFLVCHLYIPQCIYFYFHGVSNSFNRIFLYIPQCIYFYP